jgi:class III poly(R)-hydroxyalkanoic acid synthase PhaE subunit
VNDTANKTSDWLDIQRKYWETWSELGRKTLGLEKTPANPWAGALDHWWQTVSPAAPNDLVRDFMEKLAEQGKAFFGLTDYFTKGLGGSSGTQGWDTLSKTIDDMQKAFASGRIEGDETFRRLMAFWEMPLDNWQRTMSSLSPVPGDLLRNMPHDQVRDSVDRILSAPGLGYTREEQARYQDLIRRSLEYQSALQEYNGFFGQLGVKSLERMRAFLQEQAEKGTTIDSARTLYDAWVGCCEQVYADEVSTADYARIHGRLVNSQMALKQRMSTMVDEVLGALNMPTRSELRTLQDRLQEARREGKRHRREIDTLKRQVAALANETRPSPPPAAAPTPPAATPSRTASTAPKRTTTARRKTTTKPTTGQ